MHFTGKLSLSCAILVWVTAAAMGQSQLSEPRKLMGTINEESSWSPDGKTIAFDSSRPCKTNIYTWRVETRDVKGGAVRQVTNDRSDSIHPHWSPDGQRIIYCSAKDNPDQSSAPESEVYEIYTIKVGSDRRETDHE